MFRVAVVLISLSFPALALADESGPLRVVAEGPASSTLLPGNDGRDGAGIRINRGEYMSPAQATAPLEWSPDRPVVVSELPERVAIKRPDRRKYADGRYILPYRYLGYRHKHSPRFRLTFDDVTIIVGGPRHHHYHPIVRLDRGKGSASVR